jgi:hypothetical protein
MLGIQLSSNSRAYSNFVTKVEIILLRKSIKPGKVSKPIGIDITT